MALAAKPAWWVVALASGMPLFASPIVLSEVPAYNWYHGCGPTAAASVLGYWDLHGFPNLFPASGDEMFLTANVRDEISSPAHNARYDSTPDDPALPDPPDASIADFFHTSEGGLQYGWSYQVDAPVALEGYAAYRGYRFLSYYAAFQAFAWQSFVAELDAGRPMLFLVDSDADGSTDHFVPVLGYDDRGPEGRWYGLYTTWGEEEAVEWQPFTGIKNGRPWGIGYATYALPVDDPVPEPATALPLAAGLLGLAFGRRVRARREWNFRIRWHAGSAAR